MAVVAVAAVLASGGFAGAPPGFDAAGHASKVRLLLDNFPYVAWNDAWYSGHAMFTGSYPPAFHALVAVLAWIGGVSIETAMVVVGVVAMVVTVGSWYGFVRLLGNSRIGGGVAAGLLLAAPTFWAQEVTEGLYPRTLALAFVSAALAATAWYRIRPSALRLVPVVVLLTSALSSHPVVGGAGTLLAAALVAVTPASGVVVRVARGLGVAGASLALSAYFYVPLLLLPQRQERFTGDVAPAPLLSFFWPGDGDLAALPVVLVPLVGVLAVAALLTRARRQRDSFGSSRRDPMAFFGPVAVLSVAAGVMLAYVSIGHIADFDRYVIGLEPDDLLVYVAWLLAAIAGLGVARLSVRVTSRWRRPVATALVIAVAASVIGLLPHVEDRRWPFVDEGMRTAAAVLPPEAGRGDLRVAGPTDATTKALNLLADAPQVRGYQAQAVPYPDWQFWLETRLEQPAARAERRFLLDWYGVGWVYADPAMSAALAREPAVYRRAGDTSTGSPAELYAVRDPSPILSARNTPTTLVIAHDDAYEQFLRALAAAGLGSEELIVVRGGPAADQWSADELHGFDSVVLYGADSEPISAAAPALDQFVADGGTLLVEAAGGPEAADALAAAGGPTPVLESAPGEIQGGWLLQGSAQLLAGAFTPHHVDGRPWGIMAAAELSQDAEVVLANGDRPVVVAADRGRGRVVWSGFNLPFHAAAFGNAADARFLVQLLHNPRTSERADPPPRYAAVRLDSHHRVVDIDGPARGALFKENLADGWRATVNGRPVDILAAGPDLMWVPVDGDGPSRVEFTYGLVPAERAGWAITVIAWLILGLVALRSRNSTQ